MLKYNSNSCFADFRSLHFLMEDALELIEREAGRLTRHLQAVELQRLAQSSSWWWKQVQEAKGAWEDLARWRFGQKLTGPWPKLWASKLQEEEDTLNRFEGGALKSEQVLVFTSFVRCWVSDEQMLVAGLYNGALQAVHWKTGQKELLCGRHGDEVIAVALNDEHILSGSGDPGYYARRPLDASVRLWRRSDGAALGCFEGHVDSVRCVALFKSQPLMGFGMSGSLDCHVILWNLTNGSVECASLLSGPCRCMSILCEDVDSNGARARILAGSGEGVAELAVSVRQGAVTVTQLKFVSAYVEVSSLSYFHGSYRQEIDQGCWPKSFLGAPMKVAVGSVDGQLALLQGGSCRAVHELFKSRHGNRDVVSIVMISESRILLVSRAGIMTFLAWNGLLASDGPCRQLWSKTGLDP
ncbi:unnamed protein product [Cladocopium goreaui]|uniref:Uncharacterized protein n=1 Tax=Cladocopium goreaui TaxID=2562237 RepID=A0A9P1CVG3_9DINO|nr:unnamed protein product [Cladocopium goreaui]